MWGLLCLGFGGGVLLCGLGLVILVWVIEVDFVCCDYGLDLTAFNSRYWGLWFVVVCLVLLCDYWGLLDEKITVYYTTLLCLIGGCVRWYYYLHFGV